MKVIYVDKCFRTINGGKYSSFHFHFVGESVGEGEFTNEFVQIVFACIHQTYDLTRMESRFCSHPPILKSCLGIRIGKPKLIHVDRIAVEWSVIILCIVKIIDVVEINVSFVADFQPTRIQRFKILLLSEGDKRG